MNALSRKICANPMGLEKLQKEIRAIPEEKKASPYLQLIMYMMISASLSVFWRNGEGWSGGIPFWSGVVCDFVWKCYP